MADSYNRSVFAVLVEQARENAGITQAELARRVGLGQQAISKWESGDSRPRPATIRPLARALGVPTSALMVEAGYDEPPEDEALTRELVVRQRLEDGRQFEIVLDRSQHRPIEGSEIFGDPETPIDDERPGRRPRDQSARDVLALQSKLERLSERDRRAIERMVDELLEGE